MNWVKANHNAANPRHGVTCNSLGGGQILTVGGVDTTQNGPNDLYKDVFNTEDPFSQGLELFDMNLLEFKGTYNGSKKEYTAAKAVANFYADK